MRYFLARINLELKTQVDRVETKAMDRLISYQWPGNVRELKNVLTKAAMDSRGSVLLADAVDSAMDGSHSDVPAAAGAFSLEEMEKQHIFRALAQTSGNISAAARALGVSRPTLRKRLKKYGIYQSEQQKDY
jgi:two-component system response regulator AtoC